MDVFSIGNGPAASAAWRCVSRLNLCDSGCFSAGGQLCAQLSSDCKNDSHILEPRPTDNMLLILMDYPSLSQKGDLTAWHKRNEHTLRVAHELQRELSPLGIEVKVG